MPLTAPVEETRAIVLSELDQVPPVVVSIRVTVPPAQTDVTPVIVPAERPGVTVMPAVVNALPQLLVKV